MRSSNLGTILLSISIGLGFAGVMFSNISWVVLSVAFLSTFVYAQLKFASELRQTDLQIERTVLDDMAYSGQPVAMKVEVLNKHSLPVRGIFEDVIPQNCVIADGTNRSEKALPPHTLLSLTYSILPEKRGTHLIPGMKITRDDAFGLFTEEQMIEQPTIVNAHTRKDSFDAAKRMAGREHLEFSGVARNPAVVLRELEFDGIRDYIPGDRARDIHWKIFPKLGKLMTKTYRKEGSLQTMIFVDCGSSMRLKTSRIAKIDHALDLSMQISNVLLSSFHPAGAAAFDEVNVISKVAPGLGRHQFEAIIRTLREIPGSLSASEAESTAVPRPPESTGLSKKPRLAKENGNPFLSSLTKLPSPGRRKQLGFGLEGAIKEIVAHGKGQEQLFIVMSDLISSRDAVLSGARICQQTGNRMLVIHTYDEWYRDDEESADIKEIEKLYGNLSEALKVQAALKRLDALYIRVGPADTAPRIVRTIRRGKA